jgi:YD repeat-containing protein
VPGPPAATWCDLVVGVDLHVVMVPTPGGPVPDAHAASVLGAPRRSGGRGRRCLHLDPDFGLYGCPAFAAQGNHAHQRLAGGHHQRYGSQSDAAAASAHAAGGALPETAGGDGKPATRFANGRLWRRQRGPAGGDRPLVRGSGPAAHLRSGDDSEGLCRCWWAGRHRSTSNRPSVALSSASWSGPRFGAASKVFKLVARLGATRLRNFLPKARCFFTGHPVDIATGRVMTDAVDFEMPGPIPLVFERNYSSGWSRRPSPLGYGWSHSLDRALWVERSGVVCRLADGREIVFDTSAFRHGFLPIKQSIFDPITGYTLTRLAREKWRLVDEDGMIDEFERIPGETDPPEIGQGLARVVCTRGRSEHNKIHYQYELADDVARLSAVVDSGGRTIRFGYDPAGRLTKVFLPHPEVQDEWVLHASYEYSEVGDLIAATDAEGATTRYAYDRRSHLMVQETDRNGLSFYWMYDGRGSSARCVRTWGDGAIFNQKLLYNPKPASPSSSIPTGTRPSTPRTNWASSPRSKTPWAASAPSPSTAT